MTLPEEPHPNNQPVTDVHAKMLKSLMDCVGQKPKPKPASDSTPLWSWFREQDRKSKPKRED